MKPQPVVGVSCCLRSIAFGDYPATPHHTVFHKYIDYVCDVLGAVPVLLPAVPDVAAVPGALSSLLQRLDGILLTGSPSNVGVRRLEGEFSKIEPRGTADHARDFTTMRLIQGALAARIPVLGICRGMQELNVALGGDLHEEVHAVEGNIDHRSDKTLPYDQRYQPRHRLRLVQGSRLHALVRAAGLMQDEFEVNSLHGQGVSRIPHGLSAQAYADDGLAEAIALDGDQFALGVQWHLEWMDRTRPLEAAITAGFRDACLSRLATRAAGEPPQ